MRPRHLTRRANQDRSLDEASGHSLRLHLAVTAAGLRQINELDTTPARLMAIADHLDRGLREIGRRSDGLQAYSMAAQMRLHVSARAEKLLAAHKVPNKPKAVARCNDGFYNPVRRYAVLGFLRSAVKTWDRRRPHAIPTQFLDLGVMAAIHTNGPAKLEISVDRTFGPR